MDSRRGESGQEPRRTSRLEKGAAELGGLNLLLCESPLPPIPAATEAAAAELPRSNHYTEAYSAPLRRLLSEQEGVPESHLHINAGSELILRQLFDRLGQSVHLLTPTYPLFPEIAARFTETPLLPEREFDLDLSEIVVPPETSLLVLVNANNPTGRGLDLSMLPALLDRHPGLWVLVDEAFVEFATGSVAALVPHSDRLIVTRTFSKAHSLAGYRVGYAILPPSLADDLNRSNDAYPLARASQAAAIAALQHRALLAERVTMLRDWARGLAGELTALGVRTFPSDAYFFLADFSPHDADRLAEELARRQIFVKPLRDARLGPGFMRISTSQPEENARFVEALRALL